MLLVRFRDAETTILTKFAFWRGLGRAKIYGKLSRKAVFPGKFHDNKIWNFCEFYCQKFCCHLGGSYRSVTNTVAPWPVTPRDYLSDSPCRHAMCFGGFDMRLKGDSPFSEGSISLQGGTPPRSHPQKSTKLKKGHVNKLTRSGRVRPRQGTEICDFGSCLRWSLLKFLQCFLSRFSV